MNGVSAREETKNAADAVPPGARLRAVRPRDPRAALGMAVSYLMTDPVFARLPFGQWARVLVGQVNRGHYLLVLEGGKVVGFVGWAFASRDKAEAWLSRNVDLASEDTKAGDCVLINAWKASSRPAHRFMVDAFRHVIRGKETVYARRFYRDARVRSVRLPVNASVARHIQKQAKSMEWQEHAAAKVADDPR